MADYPIPVLKVALSQRVGFAESAGAGMTVLETDPTGSAAKEVKALVKQIVEMLNG